MCRLSGVCAVVVAMVFGLTGTSTAQEKTPEEELGVHRILTRTTAPYDAQAYLNRIAPGPVEGETAVQYGGSVIYSRLANIEGRVQVKVLEGFPAPAYWGMKTFLRSWDDPDFSVGNCVVCHTPTTFTNGKKYVVDESGEAKVTPTLRDMKKSGEELEKIIRHKMKMAAKAKAGEGNIDAAYKIMRLEEKDVDQLVKLMQSLDSVSKEKFRKIIVDAEILDTTDVIE